MLPVLPDAARCFMTGMNSYNCTRVTVEIEGRTAPVSVIGKELLVGSSSLPQRICVLIR